MATREHWLLPDAPFPSYAAYRDATGPSAVDKARTHAPSDVLREIQQSGLRGRGGAGFPTGTKWASIYGHASRTRFVVCNAAEGEPGTFKDCWLLRHNPYATLEGMLVAAHTVGALRAFIAIKSSFAAEVQRLSAALIELRDAGVLEDVTITLIEGPEEYLFGEEKALLEVIEGNEPLPRPADQPPYERGLFATATSANPAIVNNAETFAHVPGILRAGAPSFRRLGTQDTPGTILFTVGGDVQRPGVYEREAGITLGELFYSVAGGPRAGRTFKAALAGVSAAAIPVDKFDTPADFGSLHLAGSGLGSAGFILLDDQTSVPRVAQALGRFLYVESCNQCSACKAGLRTASQALDELFSADTATPDDYGRALYGARSAPQGNRCYLPVQGATVIPGLMERFEPEFSALLRDPAHPPAPWMLPKYMEFEPSSGFALDARQARKRPDWTYEEPAPPARKARPAARPHDAHKATAVRLAPDVAAALDELAHREERPLDAVVNDALRAWLRKP